LGQKRRTGKRCLLQSWRLCRACPSAYWGGGVMKKACSWPQRRIWRRGAPGIRGRRGAIQVRIPAPA
jgi:hypothetical protein